jgi:hypothetical protein
MHMEKYQFTPSEIEDLEKAGIQPKEISKAKQVVYSFEDWLKGDPLSVMLWGWGIRWHYLDKSYSSTTREKGELTLFILPESEWLKIEQYKEEKLKGFVLAYFEALVESFEDKEKGSLEPILLAESELRKVKDLIEDKYPKSTPGWIYSNLNLGKTPSIWLRYRIDCGDKSNLSYWFKQVCVNGENGVRYVRYRHTKLTANELNSLHPDDLHFVVSALAFHRFKGYLEAKLLVSEQSTPKRKITKVKDLPPFEDAVKEPGGLRDLWERLSEMERPFVNEFGGFIGVKSGRNVVKILALAQAIAGKIKPGYSQFDTYAMLCTLWDLPPSSRPEKALNQAAYLPTLTDIKDALA